MEKFAEQVTQQLASDINNAVNYKLAALSAAPTLGLLGAGLGAGLGAAGLGWLGHKMGSPEDMYDNGMTANGIDLKPTPAYEGQEPVPWYRNPHGKTMGAIGGALGGLMLGGMLGGQTGLSLDMAKRFRKAGKF